MKHLPHHRVQLSNEPHVNLQNAGPQMIRWPQGNMIVACAVTTESQASKIEHDLQDAAMFDAYEGHVKGERFEIYVSVADAKEAETVREIFDRHKAQLIGTTSRK
jgi:hypothetical protein